MFMGSASVWLGDFLRAAKMAVFTRSRARRVAFLALFAAVNVANAQRMTMGGKFDISSGGAATYSIPLEVPPGVGGIQPTLALNYNSSGGNGMLGVGWSLSGLSSITRCPRTMAQDLIRGSVAYDGNDRFCLDGERLILVSGTYGAPGSEYRTEHETFTKIVAYGVAAGGGPTYFVAKTAAGLIREYGKTLDSRVSSGKNPEVYKSWWLSQVVDVRGNALAVSYAADPDSSNYWGAKYPARIDYTSNAATGLVAANSVVFAYDYSFQNAQTVYQAGYSSRNRARLASITTNTAGAPVLTYSLTYEVGSASGRQRLKEIKQCGPDGLCLPPTAMSFDTEPSELFEVTQESSSNDLLTMTANLSLITLTGDFDGDGKHDILKIGAGYPNQMITFLASPSAANGFRAVSSTPTVPGSNYLVFEPDTLNTWIVADFNGDGRSDLLRPLPKLGMPSQAIIFLSKGDGTFEAKSLDIPEIDNTFYFVFKGIDLNGDGLTDILVADQRAGNPYHVYMSNGDGTFAHSVRTSSSAPYGDPIDLNGDGLMDLVNLWTPYNTIISRVSNGDGTFVSTSRPLSIAGGNAGPVVRYGDFNGDGLTDIAFVDDVGSGGSTMRAQIAFSKGDGTFYIAPPITYAYDLTDKDSGEGWTGIWGLADINGDGMADLVHIVPASTNSLNNIGIVVAWISNGNGGFVIKRFVSSIDDTYHMPLGEPPLPTWSFDDFKGEGFSDLFHMRSASVAQLGYWKTQRVSRDVVRSISNGAGNVIKWNRDTLPKLLGTRYLRERDRTMVGAIATSTDLQWPLSSPVSPLSIVTDVFSSTGVGSAVRKTSYSYGNLLVESGATGRGFLGFEWQLLEDPVVQAGFTGTGLVSKKYFSQQFPFVGRVITSGTGTSAANWSNLGLTTSNYACAAPSEPASLQMTACSTQAGSGQRYFVYSQEVRTRAWDLDGSALPGSLTQNQNPDAFGNIQTVSSVVLKPDNSASDYSQATQNTFYNDPANWFLGRLVKTVVTNTGGTTYSPSAMLALTPIGGSGATIAPTSATSTYRLSNSGLVAAASVSYGSLNGIAVSGPSSCAARSMDCGNVVLTSGTTVGTYSGTLTAAPDSGVAASVAVSMTVKGVAVLTLTQIARTDLTTTPTPATVTYRLGNTGPSAASGISYGVLSGMAVSGPTSCAANTSDCGSVTVTTNAAAATYTGTLTATSGGGNAVSAPVTLTVNTPASLGLSETARTDSTTTPTPAVVTYRVSNTGQTAATGISYSNLNGSGMTVSAGPASCAANTSDCGSVTVTTSTAAATYAGTLTATPVSGNPANVAVTLKVNSLATLVLTEIARTDSTTTPSSATVTYRVGNTGQTSAASISYSNLSGNGMTVSGGPGSCAASTTNCGSVTVTTNTAAGVYAGTLTATPTAGFAASAAVNLTVNTQGALTLTQIALTDSTTTPTPATVSYRVGNPGQTAVSGITYTNLSANGLAVSGGPTTCAPNTVNCGTVTVTTNTAAAAYSGTLTATPVSGISGSVAVSLRVNSQAALALTEIARTDSTTTPTAATVTYQLSNAGQTAANSISYSSLSGMTVTGPTSCAASASNCGSVTVTTNTSAATYAGTLTATPNLGSGASVAVSLKVNTPVALALTQIAKTDSTTTPTSATVTYRVSNTGQTAASTVSYSNLSGNGMTVSGGPASCAANMTDCGSVTVTSNTAAGTYTGTLTATPNSGAAASIAVALTVNTQAALTLTQIAKTDLTTTPTAATVTYKLGNAGGTGASSISYGGLSGMTVTGPASCAANTADCGSVVVTTNTAAATYAGTLTATPNSGGVGSVAVSLKVNTQTALALAEIARTDSTTAPTSATVTYRLSNGGQTAASTVSYSNLSGNGMTVSGPSGCAANASDCGNVTVTTNTAAATYTGTLTATPSSGPAVSVSLSLRVNTPVALTLTQIAKTDNTTTPTQASVTYRLGNAGQTTATSVSYTNLSGNGMTVSGGPASCAGSTADCGSVVVTTGTAAASYSGTLTVTPNSGSAASASINLKVNVPKPDGFLVSSQEWDGTEYHQAFAFISWGATYSSAVAAFDSANDRSYERTGALPICPGHSAAIKSKYPSGFQWNWPYFEDTKAAFVYNIIYQEEGASASGTGCWKISN
ncbi:FG-GAP-like repeat-containing protein [Burkholderiaceae bacterium UC74_6]